MPLDVDNSGAALVPGRALPQEVTMQTKQGRVLRGFWYQGKALQVGETVTLPASFAAEMVAAKKLELVMAATEAAKPEPVKAEAVAVPKAEASPPPPKAHEKAETKGGKGHAS
jgi:hypothetical protein